MTVLSLIADSLLALMAVWMFFGGKYGITRQLSMAPLAVALLDVAFVGKIQPMLTPVLSALVLMLQLVILVGCGRVLQIDHARARSKARRRQINRSRAAFEEALANRTPAARQSGAASRHSACA